MESSSLRKKIGIIAVMALACVAGLYALYKIFYPHKSGFEGPAATSTPLGIELKKNPPVICTAERLQTLKENHELPSFSEICSYIGEICSPALLTAELVNNVDALNQFFDPELTEQYQAINNHAKALPSFDGEYPLNENPLFIHITANPFEVLTEDFNSECSSVSLFDPADQKKGLFKERGMRCQGIALILSVPTIDIALASRGDCYTPRPKDGIGLQEPYAATSYQRRIVYKYISLLHKNARKNPVFNEIYETNKKGRRKSCFFPATRITHRRRLQELEDFFLKMIKDLSPGDQEKEFEKLFQRKGNDIIQELELIENTLDRFDSAERSGRLHAPSKLTSFDPQTYHCVNEIFILTKKKCSVLGLPAPEIKGIMLFPRESEDSSKEQIIKDWQAFKDHEKIENFIKEKGLSICYTTRHPFGRQYEIPSVFNSLRKQLE